jgi:predicted dehydrogenase
LKPEDYEEVPIDTEDYASVLFELENGAHGVFTVCQVAAGRKNRPYFEIDGSKCAIAWDQERPNELWIGYREKPNEILMDDPSLLSERAKEYTHFPGGHPEAYPDALKNLLKQVYSYIAAGKRPSLEKPTFSTFEDGHHEILMVDAVLKSKETGQWVEIAEF